MSDTTTSSHEANWRTCRKCEQARPLDQFSLHAKSKRHITVCRDCMPQYKRGGNVERDRIRQWQRDNVHKRAAHKTVELAIRHGTLVRQPCVRCGNPRSNAHHDDYAKPMDVLWLCHVHHFQRHEEIGKPMGGLLHKKSGLPAVSRPAASTRVSPPELPLEARLCLQRTFWGTT